VTNQALRITAKAEKWNGESKAKNSQQQQAVWRAYSDRPHILFSGTLYTHTQTMYTCTHQPRTDAEQVFRFDLLSYYHAMCV
jgi:hypothetical protein